jgi:hypothetical protein
MNSLISRINLSNFFFLFSSIWTRWFIWTFFYILQEKSQGLSFFAVGPTYSTYIWLGITKDRLNVNDGPNGRHDERSFYITQSSPFTMSSSTSHTHTWVEKILNKTVDPSLPLASFDFNFVNQMRILFLLYFWRCSITTPRSFKRIHIRAAKLFFFGGSRVSLRATMTRLSSATKGQRRRSCRIPFGSPQFSDNSRRTMTKSRERRATQHKKSEREKIKPPACFSSGSRNWFELTLWQLSWIRKQK